MMPDDAPRPLRADAAKNRERLLRAAAELFAADGSAVSLDAVARHAGVGIGTLYRHFPTRDDLVAAAYRNEVEQLSAAAGELLADRSPELAIAEWMERFVDYVATKRGMGEALRSATTVDTTALPDSRTSLLAAMARMLAAGVAAGTIRGDVDAGDVLIALSPVWTSDDESEQWRSRSMRLVGLLVDGLRAQPAEATSTRRRTKK